MQEKSKTIIDNKKLAYKILYMPQSLKRIKAKGTYFAKYSEF